MPGQLTQKVRVISRTVDSSGRVAFNQVVLDQNDPPAGVMLVAIDPDTGLHIWVKPHDVLAAHTIPQAKGYSSTIPRFELTPPPDYLGQAIFIPKDDVDGWAEVVDPGTRTNRLNHAIREILGIGD